MAHPFVFSSFVLRHPLDRRFDVASTLMRSPKIGSRSRRREWSFVCILFSGVGNVTRVGERLGVVEAALVVSLLGLLTSGSGVPALGGSSVEPRGGWLGVLAEEVAGGRADRADAAAAAARAEELLEGEDTGEDEGELAHEEGLQDEEGQTTEEYRHEGEDLDSGCGEQGEEDLLQFSATLKKSHKSIDQKITLNEITLFKKYMIKWTKDSM